MRRLSRSLGPNTADKQTQRRNSTTCRGSALLGACLHVASQSLSIEEALRHIRTLDDQLPRKAHKRFPLQLNLQPDPCRSPVVAAAPEQRRCARTRLLDAPSRPFSAQSVGRAHMQVCFTPAFALVLGLVRPIRHIAERYRTAHTLQHNRSCSSAHRRRSRLHDSPRTEATKLKVRAAQSNHVQCFAQAKGRHQRTRHRRHA